MSQRGKHCPFLNRADARCAKHFSIDDLGHAFDYCFGYYEGCSAYVQLLVERRVRRAGGLEDPADANSDSDNVIQLTVAGRLPERSADPAVVSHASGL